MKKIYSLLIVGFLALAISCADDSLDPLQFKSVKKGTILALRGTQLKNIYVNGLPGAELFPKIATGTEKFNFDAEYLSEDPSTLSSFDIYVIKKTGSTREKVLLTNIPFSSFKTTSDYARPWVSVSLSVVDIFKKLGLSGTFPLSDADINTLLTTYAFGVQMECDLNLTDGTKVLASDLVAAGLYQSNQFYPAQKLTYAMTDYCAYDANSWSGVYASQESGACCNSLEDNKFTQDPSDPNKWIMDNWWGDAVDAYVVFTPSTQPDDQIVTVPTQTTSEGGVASGTGTYNQCLKTMTISCKYVLGGATYQWTYSLTPKN